jgi:excisionase family DNA binding protein
METDTISTTEARKRLGCTSQTIRNLIKGGKLEAVQLENGRFMINLESLQTYQQNNGKKALVAKEAKQRPSNLPISRPVGSSNSGLVQQFRALFTEWIVKNKFGELADASRPEPPLLHQFIIEHLSRLDAVERYRLDVFSPNLSPLDSDPVISSYSLWQLPEQYSDFVGSIDTFFRYYDYRNRSGREASWPVHLYFILFIGDQFVARTGDQYCSQEYNSSIRSADSTIDQEMQAEKAEAIRNAGQEVKDLFHQAMMQRQAEDERKAEQIRLTLETMRENRRLN